MKKSELEQHLSEKHDDMEGIKFSELGWENHVPQMSHWALHTKGLDHDYEKCDD